MDNTAPVFPCHERIGNRGLYCALDRGHDGRHLSQHTEAGKAAYYDRPRILVPEDATKLQGPELGSQCLYKGEIVTIKARSYVWSPEKQRPDGYYGYRRYDLKVIQRERGSVLVDDKDLEPLTPTA